MSGTGFSPIPASPSTADTGVYRVMPAFRTALPVGSDEPQQRWFPPLIVMPSVPILPKGESQKFPMPWQAPLAAMPAQPATTASDQGFLAKIFIPADLPVAPQPSQSAPAQPEEIPFQAAPDYNDEELTEAFAPIMEAAVRKAVFTLEKSNIDALLEPMLRATVRRALAEYSPGSRPFQQPGFIDRTVWRFQALFSSRTYEEVLFEKTNRFQVEEAYLLDAETLALISFASCDPARHSTVKRVEGPAQRIALQLRNEEGKIRRSFERSDGKSVIAESGKYVVLVAVVRGQPNEMIFSDLEFSLHRIEEHFQERFEQAGSALMHALQPFLEDCLLIQAPASAA